MTKRTKKAKHWGVTVAVILAVLLALALSLSVVSRGFRDWSKFAPEQAEQPTDNVEQKELPNAGEIVPISKSGGMALSAEKNSSGAKLLYARIAEEDYENYGIATQAESAVTLTITNIQPETAIHKTAVWAAIWKGTASGNVADYVTVTPSSDTLSAAITCKQAFSTQIEVSATFQTGNKVKVTTTLDYIARVNPNSQITLSTTETDKTTISFGERRSANGMGNPYTPAYSVDASSVSFGAGTIVPTVSEIRDEMGVNNGTTIAINFKATAANNSYAFLQDYLKPVKAAGMFYAGENYIKGFLTNASSENLAALLGYIENNANDAFIVTYTFNAVYDGEILSNETITSTFKADVSRLTNVSSAEMDKPSASI